MNIQFLETAEPGLRWMVQYYRENPQLDRAKALQSYEAAKALLRDHAKGAERFEDFEEVWEKRILGTPFSILYTIRGQTVYVIDLRDQRGNRSAAALRKFNAELRKKRGFGR